MPNRTWFVGGIAGVLLLTALALFTPVGGGPEPSDTVTNDAPIALPDNRDTELYRSVIQRIERGESYYDAVSELHRERSYPLFPFFTVRPPVLAWLSAAVGTIGLYLIAWVALLATIGVWYRALAEQSLAVRGIFVGLLALGGASTITPAGIALHEFWSGLFIALSLAFMRDDQWRWRLIFTAVALSIREFALAFVLVLGFVALMERRWPEVLGAAALILLFGAGMFLHYQAVDAVRMANDLQSPPWTGLRGPTAIVSDLARISWLGLLPVGLAAFLAFLPLLGWLLSRTWLRAFLWFAGFAFTIMVFARPNNTYWVLVMMPAYLAGLAFLANLVGAKPSRQSVAGE